MFKILKFSWKMGLALALMLSLLTNLLFLTSSAAFYTASAAVSAVAGVSTVAKRSAAELAKVATNLTQEKAARKKFQRQLSETSTALTTERAAKRAARSELVTKIAEVGAQKRLVRSLKDEIADPLRRMVTYRGRQVVVREVVETTVSRVSRRTVLTSAREVGGIAAEAIPFVGTAAIVGFTALELHDLCETLKDMADLQKALDPTAVENADQRKVCGMRPLTKEEVWAKVKSSPGEVWASARASIPDLSSIKDYQMPEYDWASISLSSIEKTKNAWSGMVGGTSKAGKATSNAAKRLYQGTQKLIWSDEADKIEGE